MHTSSRSSFGTVSGVIALALMFSACRPKAPETPPAPVPPAPEVAAPATPDAAAVVAPGAPPAPDAAVTAATSAATPSKPAPPPRAAAMREPDLATMKRAVPASSKLGVPVDLHYQVDGAAEAGRPVTLHLAAVPRVAGTNLSVNIKEEEGLQATVAPLAQQKATAGTAYRQQMSVTRAANGPAEVRVLVTMETPEGSAFSWFGVPLTP